MRGDFIKGLRVSARRAMAIMREAALRSLADDNVARLERENEALRVQMADLSAKVEQLTDAMRQQASPKPSTEGVGEPVARPPTTGGADWEERLMERISALMDQKLDVARRAFPASLSQARPPASAAQGPSASRARNRHAPDTSLQPVQSPHAGSQVPLATASTWATVAGRKKATKKAPARSMPGPKAGLKNGPKNGPKDGPKAGQKAGPKPSRLPTSAAITVTIPDGSDVTLAAVMAAAKARIRLADLGVGTVRSRKAITGGLILEVSGPDCTSGANALAERMRVALEDLGVRIARPIKTGELRLKDLEDSVTPQEVQTAVAEAGDCSVLDVRVGNIRRSPTALGTVWVRCPLATVRKLAAAKHVVVGWVSARVDYLTSRPLQCFRCLEYGHVRSTCQSAVDRSNLCYACGEPDHRASQCTRPHRCPLCSSMGRKADHRMGSKNCSPPKGKRIQAPPAPAPEGKAAPTKGAAKSGQDPSPQETMEDS